MSVPAEAEVGGRAKGAPAILEVDDIHVYYGNIHAVKGRVAVRRPGRDRVPHRL